jgi:hypothetical protein
MATSSGPFKGSYAHSARVVPAYQPPRFVADPAPATNLFPAVPGRLFVRRLRPDDSLFAGAVYGVVGPDGLTWEVATGPLDGTTCNCPVFEKKWHCNHALLIETLGLDRSCEGGA